MQALAITEDVGINSSGTKVCFYRPELDVLRLMAFFLVFLTHSIERSQSSRFLVAIANAAAMGVPVFFFLSSYLITELLLREQQQTCTVSIRAFYRRRILRIWPVYFAALFAGFSLSHLNLGHLYVPSVSLIALLSYICLVGNWYTVLNEYLPAGMGVLWSIGVEEQFYLVWPFIIKYLTKRKLVAVSCFMWLMSQVTLFWLCWRHGSISHIWANTFPHLQYFALGALISIYLNRRLPQIGLRVRLLFVIVAMLLFVLANAAFNVCSYGSSSLTRTYPGYLIVGIGCALLLVGMLGARTPARMPALVYLGKISYGLYVYHLWCLQCSMRVVAKIPPFKYHPAFLGCSLGLVLTIFISILSYRYFEKPFLRLKKHFEIVESRAI